MLTGLFPREHGVVSFKTALPHSIPTLASILGRSGWDTAAVVNVEWLKRENYRLTQDFSKYAWAPAAVARRSPNTWVTDQVIDWVDQQTGEPLFIFAHYYDVHSDYKAEPSYERLFLSPYDGPVDGTGAQLKLQALPDAYIESCTLAFDEARCSFGDYLIVNGSTQKLELGQADVVRLEELYDAQIRQLDAELARLFTHLRKAGIFDDTLLIVTSDHGEEFMEHGSLEHFYAPYQESIRVPLLVRGPGLPAGLRVSTPVSLVDIAPTVLAQARVEAPPEMEGLDLSALWEGRDVSAFGSRFLYIEAPGGAAQNVTTGDYFPVYRGVRRGRHKLVVEQGSGTHALYDLSEDPAERQDISEREPELTAELLAVLQARHADTGEEPSPEDEVELSPEDLERLRALGYVP
jgi:arylsulfatase A-like enzyme